MLCANRQKRRPSSGDCQNAFVQTREGHIIIGGFEVPLIYLGPIVLICNPDFCSD